MPVSYPKRRVRIKLDVSNPDTTMIDVLTGASPKLWRGRDVRFEIGVFYGEDVIDVSAWELFSLSIKPVTDRGGAALASKSTSDINAALTADDWEDQTSQHFVIEFTADEMLLDMDGNDDKQFWAVIPGTSVEGASETFGCGAMTLVDDGTTGGTSNPPLGASRIPQGAVYDGSGEYDLAVVANKDHRVAFGDNDTSVTNGTETVTDAGLFITQGTSITFNGTPSSLVTATIRYPAYFTADETRSLIGGLSGATVKQITFESPSGNWLRTEGIDDDGNKYSQPTQVV